MPEIVSDITFRGHLGSVQTGRYVLYCWKKVVLSLYRLVQVLGIQKRIFPFFLGTTTRELIHGVGVVTGAMMSCSTTRPRSALSCSRTATGTRRAGCWTGLTVGSILIWYSPSSCPTSSAKTSGKCFRRLSFDKFPFGLSLTE